MSDLIETPGILGDIAWTDDGNIYIIASLIVAHIDIAYADGLTCFTFPIDDARRTPPYLEIDAAIAHLTRENGGRDGVYRLAIKALTKRRDEILAHIEAKKSE